ncbi:MAG: tetratricopeptide repeat protein [Tepidisphaeraceae bacterium]
MSHPLLQPATRHHQAGQLAEAQNIYRQILSEQPENLDALHLLGVTEFQLGKYDTAADLIGQAIAGDPKRADFRGNLGLVLSAKGQIDQAIAQYQIALSLRPDYPEAHNNLGIELAHRRQFAQAVEEYQAALKLRPKYVEAMNNLGSALVELGKFTEAIQVLQKALALNANFAQAQNNLGNALRATGRLEEATAVLSRALALRSDLPEVHNNLGQVWLTRGDHSAAIAAYRRAIELRPDYPQAWSNLCSALAQTFQAQPALEAGRKAVECGPQVLQAHSNLAVVLKDVGLLDECLQHLDQALAIDPNSAPVLCNRIYTICFHPDFDAEAILRESRQWNRRHGEPLKFLIAPHNNSPDPQRRLRIGYISPDFHRHPVGLALEPLFENHHHEQFEIICFDNSFLSDAVTKRLRACADGWYQIAGLSDAQVVEFIRKLRIDILVDLSLHMAGNRLEVFALKPAPIQVTYLGYPGTTGLDAIDYRLSDPFLDPPGTDAQYSERTVRLPHTYICFKWTGGDRPVTALPAQQLGYVTFGSLNNFCKVTPQVLRTWTKILSAVKDSRLILRCPPGEAAQRVHETFATGGIDPQRVQLTHHLPWEDYLTLCQRQDIGLDPFPYPGHTTSFDSLWMGVPMVTLRGQTAVARGGASLLSNLGLTELIAEDLHQYVRIATQLAADLPRLAELRAGLRHRLISSPLTNAAQFATDIEAAYRQMWRQWCERK